VRDFYIIIIMSHLKLAKEKILNLTSSYPAYEAINVCLNDQLIEEIQEAIIEGEQYLDDAITNVVDLNTAILALEEIIPTNETEVQEKDKKARLKIIKSLKIFRSIYILNLELLVQAVNISQQNLAIEQEGVVVDTSKYQLYSFLNEITTILESIENTKEKEHEASVIKYSLFLINVLLAYLDDYLECNESAITKLADVVLYLKNKHNTTLRNSKILRDKAEFLIYKILYRNSRPNKENGFAHSQPAPLGSDNIFAPFSEKITKHYAESFSVPVMKNQLASFDVNDIKKVKLEPFHHLNRFYTKRIETDLVTAEEGIDFLFNKISALCKQSSTLEMYNQNSFISVKKLIENSRLKVRFQRIINEGYHDFINSFQLYLRSSESNFRTELEVFETEISKIRNNTTFADYYCYLTFIRFLNQFIEEFIQHPGKIISEEFLAQYLEVTEEDKKNNITRVNKDSILRERFESLMNKIKNTYSHSIIELQRNLRLMVTHKIKPLYLTYEESYLIYDWHSTVNKQSKVFIDSAYILPINLKDLNQKVEAWKALMAIQLNNLMYAFEMSLNRYSMNVNVTGFDKKVLDSQTNFTSEVSLQTNAIKEEAKKTEFRTVSILAMFISIATFILINVKIFESKTALESIGILCGIAGCLVLFNLFFYVTSVQQSEPDKSIVLVKKIWFILLLPCLFFAGSILILRSEKESTKTDITTINDKLVQDSTSLSNLDSLNRHTNATLNRQVFLMDSILLKRGVK